MKPEEAFSSHSKVRRNTGHSPAVKPPSLSDSAVNASGTSPLSPLGGSCPADSSPDVSTGSLVANWDDADAAAGAVKGSLASSSAPAVSTFEVSQPSFDWRSSPCASSERDSYPPCLLCRTSVEYLLLLPLLT